MARRSISSSHPDRAALRSVAKTGCRQDVSERDEWRLDRPGSGAIVPLVRELDPSAGPLQFFGAELRRARTAAGLSQDQLGQRLGYSGAQVGKVETGERAPAQDFAEACDQSLPRCGRTVRTDLPAGPALGRRLPLLVRRMDRRRAAGGHAAHLGAAADPRPAADRRLRACASWRGESRDDDEELDELVSARLERQTIFERPKPPSLWAVIDEAVLHRLIGSRKIMQDQLLHLATVSCRIQHHDPDRACRGRRTCWAAGRVRDR